MINRNQPRRSYWLAAGLAAATLVTGCDKNSKKWANSPGTNGFINLDAIKEAFNKNPEAGGFEGRVNEIFEGDNLIIFKSRQVSGGFAYAAYEDLNKDKAIDSGDEALFLLTVANGRATLQGYGVNKYYRETWAYTPPKEEETSQTTSHTHYYRHGPYFHTWYYGSRWRNYHTPAPAYDKMASLRGDYRQSNSYKSQVRSNMDFENRMARKYGSGFTKSAKQTTSVRKSYINRTKNSAGFSSLVSGQSKSGWSVRPKSSSSFSSSRSTSRSFSGGGFRGSSGFGI